MHKIIKVAAIIGVVSMIGVGSAWAGRISDRQWRQEKRIHQGIRSGELTRHEARKLYQQQRRIRNFAKRAWADGWLSPRERVTIERRQDRASHHIYRLKHNNRSRW